MCQACASDVCGLCGLETDDCECLCCQACDVPVSEAEYDRHDGLCAECHAIRFTPCDDCGEDCEDEYLSDNGLCQECEAQRVEAMAEAVRNALDDESKVEAIHAALKAAGLL
jgi:hypothetical protein